MEENFTLKFQGDANVVEERNPRPIMEGNLLLGVDPLITRGEEDLTFVRDLELRLAAVAYQSHVYSITSVVQSAVDRLLVELCLLWSKLDDDNLELMAVDHPVGRVDMEYTLQVRLKFEEGRGICLVNELDGGVGGLSDRAGA